MGLEYDELLTKHLGEFGLYQKLVFLGVCLITIPGAFNSMAIVFLAAVPNHHCRVPTADHLNLSYEKYVQLTAPKNDVKCSAYDRDYTNWTISMVDNFFNGSTDDIFSIATTKCKNGWDYDKSTYQSTIVTDWDLVCSKKALVPTAASVYMAGLMVGVLLFGAISDAIGRRIAFIICAIGTVIFSISFSFSPNYIVFAALRFLLAMANIGLVTTVFVIGVELVGPSWRVFAGIVIEYFWAIGYILVAAIAYGLREWNHLAIALAVPQVLLLFGIIFLPESPRWLYTQNKHEQADTIVWKMAKMNKVTNLPDQINVEVKEAPKAYVWDLFKTPKLRMRTLNIFFNWFVNSIVYYGLSLNTGNLGGNDYVDFFISGAVEFPAYFFSNLALNYVGRRWSLAGTMIIGGTSLLFILAVPKDMVTAGIVLAMIGKFCISASFAIIYVFSAEIFPTVVRNVGIGSGSFFARVGGTMAPYIGALIDVSVFIPYISFGGLSIAAGLLALLLPETKGHLLPETLEDGEKFPHHHSSKAELTQGTENPAYINDPNVKSITKC